MRAAVRLLAIMVGSAAVAASLAMAQPPERPDAQRPRPGLTAQQTKKAVELARGAMQELRKATEGASEPDADRREYVVNVELLNVKDEDAPAEREDRPDQAGKQRKTPDPRAVVTSYRYFDDLTVFSTIDLTTGRVLEVQAAKHIPTPLSDGEYEEAIDLAKDRSDEVKRLYERFGDQITVYPQFSQFAVKEDARRHRVVHLNYRIGKRDLSYPRPQVDLTTREVVVPAPEAEPKAAPRRRNGND
jgi:hypothetical protein